MLRGWRQSSLGEVADFRNGLNFTQGSRGQQVKVVGVGDFGDREVLADFKEITSVVLDGALDDDDLLKENDLLFVRSNGNKALIGRCVLLQGVSEPLSFSGFTIRARPRSDRVDPVFLSKVVRSPLFKEHLHRLGGGSSINNLNQKVLVDFEFSLPPLSEQRRIARVIQTWDEAQHKSQQLIDVRERQHLALTHQLVFGEKRLGNFGRGAERPGHRWFNLPSDWNTAAIGEVATEISERNGGEDASEVLSCSKHDGFVRSLDYFKKQVFSDELSGYKKVWRGDFGFPSNHVEEGSIGLQNLVDVGLVSSIYTVFRFDPRKVDNNYALAALKTSLFRHLFEVTTSASVDRRGSLRWGEFSKLPFPLPSLTEQQAISAVLSENRRLISGFKTEFEAVDRQKRGLMRNLLTGKWRVEGGD